ncbi:MAG: hypothetical protein AAFU53_12885 [Cyanobacteria bacterium J06632_3]
MAYRVDVLPTFVTEEGVNVTEIVRGNRISIPSLMAKKEMAKKEQ